MVEISRAEQWPLNLYPENGENAEMVLSHYAIVVEYEGGYIIHHTITWCMYYLTADEYANILENKEFRRLRIVLDKNIDEDSIAETAFLKRAEWPYKFTYKHNNAFVIFTTTACNARCPYCYEKGIPTFRMTKRVADGVVDYIKNVHTGPIHLRWFGGEPLLNTEIIDYIIDKLEADGIEFSSSIISNSSLLYKYVDSLDKWKVNQIQITFDGIGKKYDEIKGYVGATGSTFDDVVRGIHEAIKRSNAYISVRINVSFDNVDDLDEILQYMSDNFKKYKDMGRLSIHFGRIFEVFMEDTGEDIYRLNRRISEIIEKHKDIVNYDREKYPSIIKKHECSHCSASKGRAVVINPLGKIGPCEHWNENEVFGDVFNGITCGEEKLEEWRIKSGENIAFCKQVRCPLMPTCIRYRKCDSCPYCKDERRFNTEMREIKEKIKATYEYYLQKIKERNI